MKPQRMAFGVLVMLVLSTFMVGEASPSATAQPPAATSDGYLGYRVRSQPPVTPQQVHLQDQFGDRQYQIHRIVELMNPAAIDDRPIRNDDIHLVAYEIRPTDDGRTPGYRTRVTVDNDLTSVDLDVGRPQMLLVPAAKSLDEPVPPPDPEGHDVDHFLCYDVRPASGQGSQARTVQADDQFEQPKGLDLRRIRFLCNPTNKNDEGLKNPEVHLLCYSVRPSSGEPRHRRIQGIHAADQFGAWTMDTVTEGHLCVPSTKTHVLRATRPGHCIDFEDLPVGAMFPNGSVISTGGHMLQIGEYNLTVGPPWTTGSAVVLDLGDAGGSGHDLWSGLTRIRVVYSPPASVVTIDYGHFGGGINLKVNGQLSVNDPAFLPGTLGSPQVNVVHSGPGIQGVIALVGPVAELEIGGEELAIDNVCSYGA